jgi:hypothetical protein
MRDDVLEKRINEDLRRIEKGDFDCHLIRSMFMDLREAVNANKLNQKDFGLLYEIFDFVAHRRKDNKRKNKGEIFQYSEDLIDQFVNAVINGGSVNANLVNNNLEIIFEKLFNKLGVHYDSNLFNAQAKKILGYIYEDILRGAELLVKKPGVENCFVRQGDDGYLYISFKMMPFKTVIGNLTIDGLGGPTMQFRLM